MECQSCNNNRILYVSVKCSDRFYGYFENTGETINGFVPDGFGIGGDDSDYVRFDFCLDCGQIQGDFPAVGQIVEKEEN